VVLAMSWRGLPGAAGDLRRGCSTSTTVWAARLPSTRYGSSGTQASTQRCGQQIHVRKELIRTRRRSPAQRSSGRLVEDCDHAVAGPFPANPALGDGGPTASRPEHRPAFTLAHSVSELTLWVSRKPQRKYRGREGDRGRGLIHKRFSPLAQAVRLRPDTNVSCLRRRATAG
jgi:hypothetical protein